MVQGTRETAEDATDDGGKAAGVPPPKRPGIRWDQILPRRSLRVLLVEHDDSTRQVVTALLRRCSYHVVGVADGLKAWEIMRERGFAFDLVLTEVVMPSLSGIGLLTRVVSTEECKNMPVIMMSSQDSIGVVLKCMLKGAVDFLVKPVRKNELRNLWQHVWRRHCLNSQANASDNNCNAASNRISANIGNASKTGQSSDGANEVQSLGAKEEIEIESAQNFQETPSTEGASSSKEIQEQHANAGAVQVRSDAIANDSNEPERADTTTEANNTGAVAPFKETIDLSDPPNEENCNLSEVQNNATREECIVYTKDNCFKLNTKAVLNHSESSAFSRYGERRKQILNDNPSSSSLHIRNGESFDGDLQTSTSLPPKEDAINHQSVTPPLGFIPVHFPIGSVPYGYTTILHPIYYPSYPLPDNTAAQTAGDDSNHSKHKTAEDGPNLEEEDLRELHTVIQRGSCSQDVAIASGSGETGNGNGNISVNGNLESGNESAAHTGDRSRREAALIKFRLKRKDRCFEKKVRYYNRKKLADQRPRVKGQFVSQKASNSAPQTETES